MLATYVSSFNAYSYAVAPRRGDLVRSCGGPRGWYVGSVPGGSDWVAYSLDDFGRMSKRFDALMSRREARKVAR